MAFKRLEKYGKVRIRIPVITERDLWLVVVEVVRAYAGDGLDVVSLDSGDRLVDVDGLVHAVETLRGRAQITDSEYDGCD